MEVWLFGNPDLPIDALPIMLKDRLERHFPEISFFLKDPLDEWELPKELCLIDTVRGLSDVRVFTSLEAFSQERRVTMHDFDLGMNLQLLAKLGKLPKLTIIGVPESLGEDEAFQQIVTKLSALVTDA